MGKLSAQELITRLKQGDWRVLGRAITIVENRLEASGAILEYACRNAREDCLLLGITGAGGAGKSTLIDGIIREYRSHKKRVGVIAVDPSSPFTGGAVLGDRVRMGAHSLDDGVFIRSFASRGAYGGISHAAKQALYLYKAFGFDVIIVESLGVGQAETDISGFVDVTAVVLAPGNGDHIQLAKAGTVEIADVFVINKSDRPEAQTLYAQMLSALDTLPEKLRPALVKTAASAGEGIGALVRLFDTMGKRDLMNQGTKKRSRIENEIYSGALCLLDQRLKARARTLADEVLSGSLTPFEAAELLNESVVVEK